MRFTELLEKSMPDLIRDLQALADVKENPGCTSPVFWK